MSKRNLTNPDATPDWSLSQQQRTAVDLITVGKNLQETADAIGVQRPTVSQWVNHHCGFQAALNSRRQELWDGMIDTLRGLLPQALDVLKKELEGKTPLPAAIQVLKSCGIYGAVGRPTGPTTPEEAEQAQLSRAVARAHATLTEADVQLAARQRQQDRTFAELAVL